MVNFFFFRSEIRRNAQGEMRTVLRAVPGQTTFNLRSRSLVPVRTDLHVQADSASLGRIVREPIGTVYGIRISGTTAHKASLKVYHRNDTDYYRADDCVRESDFPEDMAAAWRVVSATREPELNMNASPEADRQPRPEILEGAYVNDRLSAGREFVATIKAHAGENGLTDSEIIALSRLNDRLAAGVVSFGYIKNSDGSLRAAVGTRNREVIERVAGSENADGERGSGAFDGTHISYFDLQRRAWRSFTANNLVDVPSSFNEDMNTFVPAGLVTDELISRLIREAA